MQLSALKATTVWHISAVPFLCALHSIITRISSLKENRVLGYEYVNEKARKEWWIYMKWRPTVEFRKLV